MRISDYEVLYDLPAGEYDGRGVEGVRTMTIRAGKSLEVMAYPSMPLSAEAKREAKMRRTRPAMAKLNDRNRERHIMRLLENNFTERAFVVTMTYAYPVVDYGLCNLRELSDTYEKRGIPWDDIRVRKDVRNFIAKMKRIVRKTAGTADSLKWIIRIEEGKKSPAEGLPPKYHVHAIIEGQGLTRGAIERCWDDHGATRIERFDMREDGAKRLAAYLNKQKSAGRWWSHSRNLVAPVPTVSDRKMSRRRLSLIAADVRRNGREILEALYPGYRLVELPEVKYSDFVAGAYIYARLRRKE